MRIRRQGGTVLITVAIALAVVGAAAMAANRETALRTSAIHMLHERFAAEYLAEAGLAHAKWKANKEGCTLAFSSVSGTISSVGTYSASVTLNDPVTIRIKGKGTTAGNTSATVKDKVVYLHRTVKVTDIIKPSADATIGPNFGLAGGSEWLEFNVNGMSRVVMNFGFSGTWKDSTVVSATLKLYQFSTNATQSFNVNLHRLIPSWSEGTVTWIAPWENAGGDFASESFATTTVDPQAAWYSWNVTPLLEGWINNGHPVHGFVMIAPASMQGAQFVSKDNKSKNKFHPELTVVYHKPC